MTPAPVGLRCPEHSGKPQGIRKVTAPAQRAVTGVGSTAYERRHADADRDQRRRLPRRARTRRHDERHRQLDLRARRALRARGTFAYGPGRSWRLAHGEWWRCSPPAFLHYGPFHLAINMYSLYFAGSLLEQVIGRWRFLLLYLALGHRRLGGRALAEPEQRHRRRVRARSSGSSAALFVLERERHISTRRADRGPDRAQPRLHVPRPGHLDRRPHRRPHRRRRADVRSCSSFRRSALYSILSTVGVIAVSVVIAYMKVRHYQ